MKVMKKPLNKRNIKAAEKELKAELRIQRDSYGGFLLLMKAVERVEFSDKYPN